MTDVRCECGESMDVYDEREFTGRKEKYFVCNNDNKKKKQIIIINENGAEMSSEIVDD